MAFVKFSAFIIVLITLHKIIPSASAIDEGLRSKAIASLNTALGAATGSLSAANGLVKNRELSPLQTQSIQNCIEVLGNSVRETTNAITGVRMMKDANLERQKTGVFNLMVYSASMEQKCIDGVTASNMPPSYRPKIVDIVTKAINLDHIAATDITNIK